MTGNNVFDEPLPQSRDELVAYLRHLSEHFNEHGDLWENHTAGDYVESISGWIQDARTLGELPWAEVGRLFLAGVYYE